MSATAAEILIVDDQPDNIRTLAAILRQEGYKIRKSLNGESALESALSVPPDLILLDVRMPVMDGYQVCSTLKQRQETAKIPVIFLSALGDATDKAKGFAQGAADYITKPFQVEEVLVRIQHQLTLRQQQQELTTLNQKLQAYNQILESKVQARTQALQQSLNFEATLKRIADKVRNSLDSQQVMQTALTELTQSLGLVACYATLYEADRPFAQRFQGEIASLRAYPEPHPDHAVRAASPQENCTQRLVALPGVWPQLQAGLGFAFCTLAERTDSPDRLNPEQAIWAGPIFDDRGQRPEMVGILWLVRPASAYFSESELRLIEQVTNQCTIALRQAHLYEASQQQVQELQRLNCLKDEFLSTVSHELRTPLATISLAANMIPHLVAQMLGPAQPLPPDSKLFRYLKVLKEACQRELRLVDDLLNLQTLEAGTYPLQPIAIALSQWLPMILQPTLALAQSQEQTILFHLPPDLPTFQSDSTSLARIVNELVANACKYTPQGGRITIAAQVLPELGRPDSQLDGQLDGHQLPNGYPPGARPLCSRSVSPGELLQITIHNTGTHIPATEYDRIFDKFYRIPQQDPWKHGGTGLGLALVKKLVDYLGGTIGVTSDDQGTCFYVRFALTPCPNEMA